MRSLSIAVLLLVTACRNAQGWSNDDTEREIRVCKNSFQDLAEQTNAAVAFGDIQAAYMRVTQRPEDMVRYGCECMLRQVALTYPLDHYQDSSYRIEKRTALGAARDECLRAGAPHPAPKKHYSREQKVWAGPVDDPSQCMGIYNATTKECIPPSQ